MTIPDPRSFFGKKCIIKFKNAPSITKVIQTIDTTGVITREDDGSTTTYQFKDIALVSRAR